MNRSLFAITGLFFIFFLLILFFSEGTYDPGDGIRHFEIAHYSLQHPGLFLHHWGKPFFTFAAAGPAQFGLKGIILFNIACGLISSLLCFRIAQQVFPGKNSLMIVPFLLLTPIYFPTLFSGLTEPFFSLILTAGIFLCARKRYAVCALMLSFLPFIRTEGFLLLPLLGLFFLLKKQWIPLFLLPAGTVIYSIIGGSIFGDFLWVLHQNPYENLNLNYGSGNFFHFLGKNEFILGIPLVVLFVLGSISFFLKKSFPVPDLWFLIWGCFLIYFLSHSYFYWKGGYGSIGLIRVMAGIAPCMALICLTGYHLLLSPVTGKRIARMGFNALLLGLLSFYAIRQHPVPFKKTHEQVQIDKAAELIKSSPGCSGIIWYQHPYITYALGEDPFNLERFRELWDYNKNDPCFVMGKEDCIVWDSHYAQYEAGIKDKLIEDCGNIVKVAEFVSEEKEADMIKGSDFYRVIIFNKRPWVQTFPLSDRR